MKLKCTRDPETSSKFAPENGWLEYFLVNPFGAFRPIFRGELLVSGSVFIWRVCVCVCVCVSKSVSKIHDQQIMHGPLTCQDSPLNTECF